MSECGLITAPPAEKGGERGEDRPMERIKRKFEGHYVRLHLLPGCICLGCGPLSGSKSASKSAVLPRKTDTREGG